VPAAAVIQGGQAIFFIERCKRYVGLDTLMIDKAKFFVKKKLNRYYKY
jgi:hypothetical protein